MESTLYYLHDPMCSWCWGYKPTWKVLQKSLPNSLRVEYVAGGLAPDSDSPMPIAQQQMIQDHWRNISLKLGTKFNYEFWSKNTPRRSTYNACRAAIAAHKQGCQQQMVEAIQQAYYLQAMNPSDLDVLVSIAEKLSLKLLSERSATSLNLPQFIDDINAPATDKELARQVQLARKLSQQGFPSLVLAVNGIYHQIELDYLDFEVSLTDIVNKLSLLEIKKS